MSEEDLSAVHAAKISQLIFDLNTLIDQIDDDNDCDNLESLKDELDDVVGDLEDLIGAYE